MIFSKLPIGILVIALVFASCVSNKKFTELESERNALAESVSNLEEKVGMLETDKNQLSSTNDEMTEKLASVEGQLQETEQRVSRVNSQMEDNQSQITMLRKEIQSAFSDVEKAVSESGQRITEIEDMLYLDLENPINFTTGSSRLNREDNETLGELADMLKKNPGLSLIIEGHTDDRPINNARFRDNWDLSVARSVAIVRKLISLGVEPKQLTAAGKAEFHPTATDDPKSAATRSANRRSEVIMVPQIGRLYKLNKNQGT
ncbi:MAG: OmpA family protein [Saprospiraceae bacterium]|nr:OmpA family protein [Saprospiraceae bacterium]